MINYQKDQQGIVTLTFDNPGKPVNVINIAFGEAFKNIIEKLQAEKDSIIGIIITSAKESFMAGADIDEMFNEKNPQNLFDRAQQFKAGLRYLETQGKPVVAAINGTALGGGFEVALACHRRIVIDNPKTQLGLPEVTLGLLPGGGGVTRMVRMLGLQPALAYLSEGKKIPPDEALKNRLIHELVIDKNDLIEKAKAWILANPSAVQAWDDKNYKIPGGTPNTPKVAQVLPVAPAVVTKKTHNNYPAPLAILSAAVEGALVDFDTATRIESRYFVKLATGKVAKNMIKAFWTDLNAINAGNSRPTGSSEGQAILPRHAFKKVGVIGAGMMGSAIAYCIASNGMECVLKDVSEEAAMNGKSYSEELLKKLVGKGKINETKAAEILNRIQATSNAVNLKGCDLMIEAVFENRELKAKVTKEAEEQIAGTTIFASNTSTLPITGLAEKSMRPNNFIGLHFFSPADRMPLVEIIVGKQTSNETLARAFDFVKAIKKTPIVVNDSRGFYTSRVFATYVLEGIAMLGEGINPRSIEAAGLQAGMPVGPLVLTDEISLSLLWHIRQQTIADLKAEGKTPPEHPAYIVADKMLNELKRPGKAAGAGFYEYVKDEKKKHLWTGLKQNFPEKTQPPQKHLIDRLMFIQAIETVRCLEEGVLRNIPDANIGAIFGWGFAPFKGGTLQYINDYGLKEFIARAKELQASYGERFAVPMLLEKKVATGNEF